MISVPSQVSGLVYSSTDNEQRISDLQSGKMYQAWKMMREKLLELKAKNLPELGVGGYGSKGGSKPRSSAISGAVSASADHPSVRDRERGRERGYSDRSDDRGYERHRDDRDRRDRECAHPGPALPPPLCTRPCSPRRR